MPSGTIFDVRLAAFGLFLSVMASASVGVAQNMSWMGPYGGLYREPKFCTKTFSGSLSQPGTGNRTTITYDPSGRISGVSIEREQDPTLNSKEVYAYKEDGDYTVSTYFGNKLESQEEFHLDRKGRVEEVTRTF